MTSLRSANRHATLFAWAARSPAPGCPGRGRAFWQSGEFCPVLSPDCVTLMFFFRDADGNQLMIVRAQ